jgi:superfamily II DNA or RNA helicase
MFGHQMLIRSSTNDHNPCRGLQGFVTTYQAAAVDYEKTTLRDFERYRYILVLDEFHHLEESGEWTEPIRELYRKAAFRVLMTGTMARGDEKRIAFLNYVKQGDNFVACPIHNGNHAYIGYICKDALADRAIIPLEFHFADGVANWRKVSGKEVTAKLSTSRSDANQALYTALKTEYAQELLAAGVTHWQDHSAQFHQLKSGRAYRVENPENRGSLLVVAPSIETAKEYTSLLKRQGLHAEIATSDDTPHAVKQIKALKAGKLKIMVSVGMCYEGLDVPSISHIVCLTNIRSQPWIEQMVARAVRIDPLAGPYETQKGFIFAPADRMFVELARRIEADQTEAVARVKEATMEPGTNGDLFGGGGGRPKITPLSSKLLHGQGNLFNIQGAGTYQKTQREIEAELRGEIDDHVKAFCRVYCVKIAALNRQLKELYGKSRESMTVAELRNLKSYLGANYAVPQRKEPGVVLTPVPVRW